MGLSLTETYAMTTATYEYSCNQAKESHDYGASARRRSFQRPNRSKLKGQIRSIAG